MAVVLLAGGGLTASSADDTGLRDEREGEGGRGKGEGGRGKGEGGREKGEGTEGDCTPGMTI